MNERPTFNHGHLCEMLRAASDFDLANVILDVKKEQERRSKEQGEAYAKNIMEAIREAVEAGFVVSFFSDNYPDYSIHSNCLPFLNVYVDQED